MAKQDILELCSQLAKAGGDDGDRCVDLMKAMHKVPMTYELLVETKVGQVVKPHKKSADPAVAEAAKGLLKHWRAIADAHAASQGLPLPPAPASSPRSPRSHTSAELPAASAAAAAGGGGGASSPPRASKEETGPHASDGGGGGGGYSTELAFGRAGQRDKFRERLLLNDAQAAAASGVCLYRLAEDTEAAVHSWSATQRQAAGGMDKAYGAKCRQLLFNLKKNAKLRSAVVSGHVTPSVLVRMDKDALADESVTKERAAMAEKLGAEVALDYAKRADVVEKKRAVCGITEVVSMFKCIKCGSRNLNNWEKQTRSADEPMTQFFQCLDCNKQWRVNG